MVEWGRDNCVLEGLNNHTVISASLIKIKLVSCGCLVCTCKRTYPSTCVWFCHNEPVCQLSISVFVDRPSNAGQDVC